MLSEKEKQEFTAIAEPRSLKDDMRYLTKNRHNPFLKDGKVDIDRYIDFLNVYNEFISHKPKPFKPMIDKIMKL
jgi:hypothetical protein